MLRCEHSRVLPRLLMRARGSATDSATVRKWGADFRKLAQAGHRETEAGFLMEA